MWKWNKEKAHSWYKKHPLYAGANFVPSTASNQLEMWQADTFDPKTIEKELKWAAKLGMNLMRVYLHDLVWLDDAKGFKQRINQYLEIANKQNIKTCFVFFDDCWNPDPHLGPQKEPTPFTHNSRWVQSPGIDIVNNPARWGRLEAYVKDILESFKNDKRILFWDLYNEPGNGPRGDNSGGGRMQKNKSLPLLRAVFKWARSIPHISQPITAGIWRKSLGFKKINNFLLEHSDIITFHSYDGPYQLRGLINKCLRAGRPMICTEYMCRPISTFKLVLPVFKEYGISAINWGLVSGRTNTIYPWGWNEGRGEPEHYFHDIFTAKGEMLYEEEREEIEKFVKY